MAVFAHIFIMATVQSKCAPAVSFTRLEYDGRLFQVDKFR